MMLRRSIVLALSALAAAPAAARAQEWDPRPADADLPALLGDCADALAAFLKADPSLKTYLDQAYGYAVFPRVKKGGFAVGAARGKGLLYRGGQAEGIARLTQVSVGLQAGGKVYREVIFFRDPTVYEAFRTGSFKLSGQASATAATYGAADQTAFSEGVAVFVLDRGGLMAEASIAGQRFEVTSLR